MKTRYKSALNYDRYLDFWILRTLGSSDGQRSRAKSSDREREQSGQKRNVMKKIATNKNEFFMSRLHCRFFFPLLLFCAAICHTINTGNSVRLTSVSDFMLMLNVHKNRFLFSISRSFARQFLSLFFARNYFAALFPTRCLLALQLIRPKPSV